MGLDREQGSGIPVGAAKHQRLVDERFDRGLIGRALRIVASAIGDDACPRRDDQRAHGSGEKNAKPTVLSGIDTGPCPQRRPLGR